jgi:hypothetical protein
MADFAVLGKAMARVLGREEGDFLKRYIKKRRANVSMTLDASPTGAAVREYLAQYPGGVSGTVAEVYKAIGRFMPDEPTAPKSPRGFANALRRVAPALAQLGITVKFGERTEAGITCSIKRVH